MSTHPPAGTPEAASFGPVPKRDYWLGGLLLVVGFATLLAIYFVGRGVDGLDQDNLLIDRGQQVNNCIGDRADAIDDWRAIFLGLQAKGQQEYLVQVDRVQDGLPIDTTRADRLAERSFEAERNIRLLVQEKRDIRDQSRQLVDADNPELVFDCVPIADDLVPPPIR